MKIKLFTTYLCCTLIYGFSHAQTIHVDTTRHDKGTTEVIVFSSDKNKCRNVSGFGSTKTGHDNNIVKVGLLYWVNGVIPVYYERKLTPWLTVQGGVGLTTRDFIADLMNEIIYTAGDGSSYNTYYSYQHRKALVGYYLSAQPKFYLNNDAMDGFYISPWLEFKHYAFKANMVDPTQPDLVYLNNAYQNEHRNCLDFTINCGWQWMYNPLTIEFNLGAGFRRYWESRLDIEQGNTGYYTNGLNTFNGYRPEFNIDFNFGGFF